MYFYVSLCLLLIVCPPGLARPHEPSCSQFDFQEKLLEKTVRYEHKLDVFEEKFRTWEARLSNKLDALKDVEDKLGQMSATFDKSLEEKEKEFDLAIEKGVEKQDASLKGKPRTIIVVFLAQEVSDFDVDVNKVVKFTKTVTNEGKAYDVQTGKFTAPCDGSYIFSTTVCSWSIQFVLVKLVAGSRDIGSTGLFNANVVSTCASTSAMTMLSKGDKVWVEGIKDASNALYDGSHASLPTVPSFSGMLIHTAGTSQC